MFYYHLRVTISDASMNALANEFVKKFKAAKYIFSSETSEQDVEHMHGHIEYEEEAPKRQTVSDFFKKYNLTGKYYHKELVGEPINNKLYVFKELDIVKHNLTADEYKQLESQTIKINEDKSKEPRDKLVEEIRNILPQYIRTIKVKKFDLDIEKEYEQEETINDITLRDITIHIRKTYTRKYKKNPPSKSLMFQYTLYIADQLDICEEEVDNAYEKIF